MGAMVTAVRQLPLSEAAEQEQMLALRLEGIHASRQLFGEERRGLIDTLVTFMLGTLTILIFAIIGLAFVDMLCAWVRTVRTCIILASLGLGPATHPRDDIKQWTVRLSHALIEAVEAQATAEGKEPSHLVEEVLWQALTDRRSSAT